VPSQIEKLVTFWGDSGTRTAACLEKPASLQDVTSAWCEGAEHGGDGMGREHRIRSGSGGRVYLFGRIHQAQRRESEHQVRAAAAAAAAALRLQPSARREGCRGLVRKATRTSLKQRRRIPAPNQGGPRPRHEHGSRQRTSAGCQHGTWRTSEHAEMGLRLRITAPTPGPRPLGKADRRKLSCSIARLYFISGYRYGSIPIVLHNLERATASSLPSSWSFVSRRRAHDPRE